MSASDTPNTQNDLGPLEPILQDPNVTEVLVDGPNHIYIERNGKKSNRGWRRVRLRAASTFQLAEGE